MDVSEGALPDCELLKRCRQCGACSHDWVGTGGPLFAHERRFRIEPLDCRRGRDPLFGMSGHQSQDLLQQRSASGQRDVSPPRLAVDQFGQSCIVTSSADFLPVPKSTMLPELTSIISILVRTMCSVIPAEWALSRAGSTTSPI